MATIAKVGTPSLATMDLAFSNRISGLKAGEAIAAGDACYIKSDGKIWRSNGTAANAAAVVMGFALAAAAVGESCTIVYDCQINYGSGLTPGASYFASATAGAIDDAATTGGTKPVAIAVDATKIFVQRSRY